MGNDIKPAVFLDRDGVLCVENGIITRPQEVVFFPYILEAIKIIHDKGYYVFVVTNQSGIARGLFSEEELMILNKNLVTKYGIDEIYYCPHYERGIIPRYSVKCSCRKPNIGLVKKACGEYPIDMSKSYIVGDRASDILMGKKVGLRTVLLESGYGSEKLETEVDCDLIYDNLLVFAKEL